MFHATHLVREDLCIAAVRLDVFVAVDIRVNELLCALGASGANSYYFMRDICDIPAVM